MAQWITHLGDLGCVPLVQNPALSVPQAGDGGRKAGLSHQENETTTCLSQHLTQLGANLLQTNVDFGKTCGN